MESVTGPVATGSRPIAIIEMTRSLPGRIHNLTRAVRDCGTRILRVVHGRDACATLSSCITTPFIVSIAQSQGPF